MLTAMTRLALLALVAAACSKSAGNQENPSTNPPAPANDRIAVPGGATGAPKGSAISGAPDERSRLHAEEGKLAVVPPDGAAAGSEAVAKITVTPGAGYHVNTEYPTKLTLQAPDGVTVAKAELTAGGHDKAKGDADALDEQNLTFLVKLTPAKSGSYTVNGSFKFAVCDKDQCLPKKEQIAIVVAAK